MFNSSDLEELSAAIEALEQEQGMDVTGLLDLLRRLLKGLNNGGTKPVPGPSALRDGRYKGGNFHLSVDLRVDEEVSGVISADLYRKGLAGPTYVASIRTAPGERISLSEGSWMVVGQDEQGAKAMGTLALQVTSQDPITVSGNLTLDSALHSLPVRRAIGFSAEWVSPQLRTLGIEREREEIVEALPQVTYQGQDMSVDVALKNVGLNAIDIGRPNVIPVNENGWGNTQLHTLLRDFAQASLERRAWEMHLLVLSKATRPGLLGIMFDTQDRLPRQGTAIFANTIRELFGSEHQRKLIQTTVHEIGHGLNLAHRFERVVGRADSLSFMNYDWRYKGGNHAREYWSGFNYTFDHDEMEFLRHAPLPALIPGGAAFHSVNYWADGNGGYSPYVPEVPLEGYQLSLEPPLGGNVFEFGQPVFLQVELTNLTGQPVDVPPILLDPKAGFLEILIKRWEGSASLADLANAQVFVPIYQRCFDMDPGVFDVIQPGKSIKDNLNLTFGSGGFAFAEPGAYDITALLALYDSDNEQEFVVRSNPVRIRVGVPKSADEERDAMVLLRNDVGLYFALGGSDGLDQAHKDLQALKEKRQGKRETITDPIVSNIVRCEGINVGRPYIRFVDGKFEPRDGDRPRAAELLQELTDRALYAFDASTAESTQRLAKKHQSAANAKK